MPHRILDNITSPGFAVYGKVVRGGIDDAVRRLGCDFLQEKSVRNKTVKRLYVNKKNPTIIDRKNGTAILYVGKTPGSLESFLLYKTVIIEPNVYYVVVPLISTATILLSVLQPDYSEYIEVAPDTVSDGINPNIHIKRLYTLVHHEKEMGLNFLGEEHDIWEPNFVEKGNFCSVVNKGEKACRFEMGEGEVMLYVPNQWHEQYTDKNALVSYVTIAFDMDFDDISVFKNRCFAYDKEISRLMGNILAEKESNDFYSEDMIMCHLKEILVRLIRISKIEKILDTSAAPVKTDIENDIIRHVKEYIQKNIEKKLGVSGIAKNIPVNASYLSTLFKRTTGTNLVEYITEQKLEKAAEYIKSGKYSLTQIADMLSFNSPGYFSRQFKSRFGVTPSEYAKIFKKI